MHGVGPGSVLGGRYTVGEPIARHPRYERWTASDDTLHRDVVVLCFPAGAPRAASVADAARRAAALDEPRLARVLDVGTSDGLSWVVEEPLTAAHTVSQLLADGPLPAAEVRRIVGESSAALATAAVRGLHHGTLGPMSVLRQPDGAVTIRGLATEAALLGADDPDPVTASRTDAVALVALAYAGLTGRWPLVGIESGLDPAPVVVGGVASPSEIVAGVPADLDTITRLTLCLDQGPLTPAGLAAQIAPWSSTPYVDPYAAPFASGSATPDLVEAPPAGPSAANGADLWPVAAVAVTSVDAVNGTAAPSGGATRTVLGMPVTGLVTGTPGRRSGSRRARIPRTGMRPGDRLDAGSQARPMSEFGGQPEVPSMVEAPEAAGAVLMESNLAHSQPTPAATPTLDSESLASLDSESAPEPDPESSRGLDPNPSPELDSESLPELHSDPSRELDSESLPEPDSDPLAEPDSDPLAEPNAATAGSSTAPATGRRTSDRSKPDTAHDADRQAMASDTDPHGIPAVVPSGSDPTTTHPAASLRLPATSARGKRERVSAGPPRRAMRMTRNMRLSEALAESSERPEAPAPYLSRTASETGRHQSSISLLLVTALVVLASIAGWAGVSRIGSSDTTPAVVTTPKAKATTSAKPTPTASASSSAPATALQPVAIVGSDAWDPEGDQQEGNASAPRAYDGDPATMWRSQAYQSAPFGGYGKSGIGLVLDLGQPATVHQVSVLLRGGADFTAYVADVESLDGATAIGSSSGVDGQVTLDVPSGTTARGKLVILWFTRLAPDGQGSFRAQVAEVAVS